MFSIIKRVKPGLLKSGARHFAAERRAEMQDLPYRTALIVGAGSGISAALARGLSAAGLRVGLAARDAAKLAPLAAEIGALAFAADASDPASVARLFAEADAGFGEPDVVIYNASARAQGPLAEIDPEAVRQAMAVTAFGGFLVVQQAARRMLPHRRGAILLTGATASVKGFALSAAFAMGKFALRGLAQSAARELGPQGIHVAHVVVDGGVRSARRPEPADRPDSLLSPEGIAQTYLSILRQPRDAWSLEVELRPWVEKF
jgi:NAD(P)-dependent dehydrogenase (short-subunit alcohol dehydrogenase family)